MTVHATKTFKSGNSVAVRLPSELGVKPGEQVTIERRGNDLILRPAEDPEEVRAKLRQLVADLKAINAGQGTVEEREPIEFPDRPGLY